MMTRKQIEAEPLLTDPIYTPSPDEVRVAINAARFLGRELALTANELDKDPKSRGHAKVASAKAAEAAHTAVALCAMLGTVERS